MEAHYLFIFAYLHVCAFNINCNFAVEHLLYLCESFDINLLLFHLATTQL